MTSSFDICPHCERPYSEKVVLVVGPTNLYDIKILDSVSSLTGVLVAEILGDSRSRSVTRARSLFVHVLRVRMTRSYAEIGKALGRSTATIMKIVNGARDRIKKDQDFERDVSHVITISNLRPLAKPAQFFPGRPAE